MRIKMCYHLKLATPAILKILWRLPVRIIKAAALTATFWQEWNFVMINYTMTMRAFILKLIITGCFSGTILDSMAQQEKIQYVMLDMLDSLDKHSKWDNLNRYTLKTEELYGVDETIEMYN